MTPEEDAIAQAESYALFEQALRERNAHPHLSPEWQAAAVRVIECDESYRTVWHQSRQDAIRKHGVAS